MTENRAKFIVSGKLLDHIFKLPDDCKITAGEWDCIHNTMTFYVKGQCLPKSAGKEKIPTITPSATYDEGFKIDWNWEISKK